MSKHFNVVNSSPLTDDESSCNDEVTVIMSCNDSLHTAENASVFQSKDIALDTPQVVEVIDQQRNNNQKKDIGRGDGEDSDCLIVLSTTPVNSEFHPKLSSAHQNDKIESPPSSNWCQNESDESASASKMDSSCLLRLNTPSTSGQRKASSKISCVNTLEDNIQDLSLSSAQSESLHAFNVSSDSEMSSAEIVNTNNNESTSHQPKDVQNKSEFESSVNGRSHFSDNDDSTDSIDQLNLTASLNFSKLLIKRKQSDTSITTSKKKCMDKEVRRPDTAQHTDTPLTSGASSALTVRKRIPSKEHPPPELGSWLHTFQNWSNAERLMAVDQLIELCEPTQVRHMMAVIEPQFQRDFISLLPKELALYVLSFLEPRDLLRAAQTCRYWRILAEDNLLWREKCREAGVDEVREVLGKRRAKSLNVLPSPWKSAYMRQHNIEMNWRFRDIRIPKALKGHDDHVITCLQFSASRIVSGSDDNTLKVWAATTGKCLRTLVGHTGGVWSSQMAGNIIVSGSTDRTLKVWNSDTGQCIHTLYGHTSTVRCMALHENKVVSGSRDATLRVWNIDSGECLHVLIGHVAAVRCVQYDGKLVVSGAYDYMVKVWNPEQEECLHTLQGHTNRVYSLQFDGVHVVSGSLDTSIRVWDVETGSCKHTLMGHQSLTSGMELKNNILVSGNADSTVKVWDITTGQCLQTLSGSNKHHSAVTCLQFNSTFVITSSDDGTVKLWDLKTGDFIRNLVALESGGSGGVVWRIRASHTKLVCAVGSRNGTEETKLLVLDFDVESK